MCCLGMEAPTKAGGRDRIVVSTLRCGRSNPGSNPGHGNTGQLCFIYVVALTYLRLYFP